MKSPNTAVLSPTALVRRAEKIGGPAGSRCRTIDFGADAHEIRGRRDVDYATNDALISLKVTHRIGVQLAVAKSQ
jgi:hypothetical protein